MKPSNTDTQQVERDIEGQAPGASAEQAADLAALTAAAGGGEGGQVQADEQEAGQIPQPSEAAMQVAALAVGILRPVLAYAVPALRTAPDALWEPVPGGVAGILDHYGIGVEALQSPWARLALACAPLAAFAAVEAMKEPPKKEPTEGPALDLTERKPEPVQAVNQKTVTFGGQA
jgi:hypothetical protein